MRCSNAYFSSFPRYSKVSWDRAWNNRYKRESRWNVKYLAFPQSDNGSVSTSPLPGTSTQVKRLRKSGKEITKLSQNANPDARLPRYNIHSNGPEYRRCGVKRELRKRWGRADPTVNTHSKGPVNVAWSAPSFLSKLHLSSKDSSESRAAQVCAGTRYLNSRLHKRLYVSLTWGTLGREKGYAKLLLPPTPGIGDDEVNRCGIKKLGVRWRIPFIRIQIAVHVGKVSADKISWKSRGSSQNTSKYLYITYI